MLRALDRMFSLKWAIAALALVTWPASFWLVTKYPFTWISKIWIFLGAAPLLLAGAIELRGQWRIMSERPEEYVEGSPIGNKLAVVLGLVFLGCVFLFFYYAFFHL